MSYPYQQTPQGYGQAPPPQGYGQAQQGYPQPGIPQPGIPQPGYGSAPPPPPPGQHNYPQPAHPAAPYGAPQYGALPASYGAPQPGYAPQQGYGAPPAGYGAPPPSSMQQGSGLPPGAVGFYLNTPIPAPAGQRSLPPPPGFDPNGPVESIRKATKGFGTDEKALIATLAPLDAIQMDAVSRHFVATTGKDLIKVIEKETSGNFEGVLRAKALGPVGYDCWLIHDACKGAGTKEAVLDEVLLCRTNEEMAILHGAYRAIYNKDMTKVVEDDLSVKTKRLFTMALKGARTEDNTPVDQQLVEKDVKDLHAAAKGAGTDEVKICGILASRSTPHLQALSIAYQDIYRKPLTAMIKSEFSGHMESALLYIANTALPGPPGITRDAQLIEEAMKGAGTKDHLLIMRVIRAHWNRMRFEEVKRIFAMTQSKNGLRARVDGETSGDYGKFLLAVIGT